MSDRPTWPELRRALLEETEPPHGLEHRMLSAFQPPVAQRRPSWVLGAVAAALAILVTLTLLLAERVGRHGTIPAAPPPPSPATFEPPPISTLALSPAMLDGNGAGWVVEHAQQPPRPGRLTLLHTADGGAHWTHQLDLSAGFADMRSGPADQALLYEMDYATGPGTPQPPQSFFYGTSDGGAHWQRFSLPMSGIVEAVQIRDGREAWLTMNVTSTTSGPPDQWAIFHTSDGAKTWQRLATVNLAATFGASNLGATRTASGQYSIFIPRIGNAPPTRLYTTSDGGAHWRGSPIPTIPSASPDSTFPHISVLAEGHLVAIGQGSLLVSDDGGQQWSEPRRLPSTTPGGVYALDSTHWWLVTRDGLLFSSGDEGVSWMRLGSLPRGMTLNNMGFTSPSAGWATASYLRPGAANVLLTSDDGGRTWRPVPPPHPFRPAVPCGGAGATVTAHARLSVSRNGKTQPEAVPAGVGVVDACRYRLSTADTSGTIDIASTPDERGHTYTLGDLLDVWGVPDVASFGGWVGPIGQVTVRVNGKLYTGDPRAISLRDRTQVVIEVTDPSGGG